MKAHPDNVGLDGIQGAGGKGSFSRQIAGPISQGRKIGQGVGVRIAAGSEPANKASAGCTGPKYPAP